MTAPIYLMLLGFLGVIWGGTERFRKRYRSARTEKLTAFVQGPLALVMLGMMGFAFFEYGIGTGVLSVLVGFGVGALLQGPG